MLQLVLLQRAVEYGTSDYLPVTRKELVTRYALSKWQVGV